MFQAMALVSHANALLGGDPVQDFYPGHRAFTHVEHVRFVDLERRKKRWIETPLASDPLDWFQQLKRAGCQGLRIKRIGTGSDDYPDRVMVAFVGGGGRWIVEPQYPDGCDQWEGAWSWNKKKRPDQSPWRVSYGRIARRCQVLPDVKPDLPALAEDFAQILDEALAFAKKSEILDWFSGHFELAMQMLQGQEALQNQGLVRPGQLSESAERLLCAAQKAWVFGGMGSWNDVSFDGKDQDTYERISQRLFDLINSSLQASVNQTYTGQERGG